MVCFCLIFSALPVVPVHAADDDDDGGVSASVDVEVDVPSELAISVSDSALRFAMASNSPTSQSLTLTVETTSTHGYFVSLNTSYSYNDLKHSDSSVTETIPSITADTTLDNFSGAAWGYSLTEATNNMFHKIPTEMTQILSGSTAGFNEYDFSIGVKTASNTPSGTYSNTLVFTALANLAPANLNSITYMQDMTAEICSNTEVGTSKQLIDSRDGKNYWVTKLADNNCWMTQNLALNLSTNKALTPDDSDVTANWTPNSNTGNWDWGTQNPTWSLKEQSGTYIQNGNSNTLISTSTLSTDSIEWHWARGVFYNWLAATAGGATDGSNTTSSVCPKGWKLPTNFSSLSTAYNDRLYQLYGAPVYLPLDGPGYNGVPNTGSNGAYWISSTNNGAGVYMNYDVWNDSSSTDSAQHNAVASIRCIAR